MADLTLGATTQGTLDSGLREAQGSTAQIPKFQRSTTASGAGDEGRF